ncbi:MAG TPA: hypothetical protein VFT99_16065, partial [Roseiflexaceae bacterium]|nr:hypothetical protein [Roseiflexaceae bacterium]
PPTAGAHGLLWNVWMIHSDGSGLRRLATLDEDLPMSVFSPDGTQIAIIGGAGIYLMEADGSQLRRIDPTGDHGGLDWLRAR